MESTTYAVVPTNQKKVSVRREVWSQVAAISVNNLLIFSGGMAFGFATILIPGLVADRDEKILITETEISWIGSINYMCSIIGCFLSGIVTQPFGRIRALHIACPFLFATWCTFKFATQVWHIYMALSLCGWLIAVIEAPLLSYKAEVCQPHLRGMLSATSTLASLGGVLLQFVLGTFFHWRIVAVISSVPAFAGCIVFFFMPESPYWLIMQSKIDKARTSLAWLRGWTTVENIQEEFQRIWNNCNKNKSQSQASKYCHWKRSLLSYTRKDFLWPLALVSFLSVLSNFTGFCTLQTYAVSIFGTFQAPIDHYYATVILGVAQVVGSFVSLFSIRYFGKRITGFVSVLGIGVCDVIIGIYAYVFKVEYLIFDVEIINTEKSEYSWVPLCTFIAMAFIGNFGIRVLPWILFSEVFSHEKRAAGCGIGSGIFFFLAFLANKVFLVLISYLGIAGVHWLYATICVFGVAIAYFILPETEGKDLQEIINHFSNTTRLDNNVGIRKIKETVSSSSYSALPTADETI